MSFQQTKLSKSEWNSIEVPVSEQEKQILTMILNGYNNVSIRNHPVPSLLSYMKMVDDGSANDAFLYNVYFKMDPATGKIAAAASDKKKSSKKSKNVAELFPDVPDTGNLHIKNATKIRIEQTKTTIQTNKSAIFEFVLIEIASKIHKYFAEEHTRWVMHYYTLYHLHSYKVPHFNIHVAKYIDNVLAFYSPHVNKMDIIRKAADYIERNSAILQYSSISLYDHQKQLFGTFRNHKGPKLVLYTAPTGTGKTLSPIGLSEKYKVIFVCAARHVGLALAKSAIAVEKKIAFAFGCQSADDIRLHYFAAKEYTRHNRSGGIYKVDNSVGDKVEIMITDIGSYIYAMYYMCSFNPVENLVMYWDEPTISLDYEDHPIHEIIHDIWEKNAIPNIVLSSATLPREEEIQSTIMSFRQKFYEDPLIRSIVSHDCKKTIPIINSDGYAELPHFIFDSYSELRKSVEHCNKYQTLLRYMDLAEIVRFCCGVNLGGDTYISNKMYLMDNYFDGIEDITMINIKLYYLKLLQNIVPEKWGEIHAAVKTDRAKRLESSVYVTTSDAHTLTDGATIYLTKDVEKIAKFCIQQAEIPEKVMNDLLQVIQTNNAIQKKLIPMEKDIEDKMAKYDGQDKKISQDRIDPEIKKMKEVADKLREKMQIVTLKDLYVPNRLQHLTKWAPKLKIEDGDPVPFTSDIDEATVEAILALPDVEPSWKILLLMGVGVFNENHNSAYIEIMKSLADKQRLYMIIANTDYIYGTNYQFCHGYIGKDLIEMTQEKAIQALGRVGRNNIQQPYSLRFRGNDIIRKLFCEETYKPEVKNMNRLLA